MLWWPCVCSCGQRAGSDLQLVTMPLLAVLFGTYSTAVFNTLWGGALLFLLMSRCGRVRFYLSAGFLVLITALSVIVVSLVYLFALLK